MILSSITFLDTLFLTRLIIIAQLQYFHRRAPRFVFERDVPPNTLNVDDGRLQEFLRSYVFFNHFVLVSVKLSYSTLVQAWNRRVTVMCKSNTTGIDYVIPVMKILSISWVCQ